LTSFGIPKEDLESCSRDAAAAQLLRLGEPTCPFGQGSSNDIIISTNPKHTERGSPSLVGRGIANPMSERTRGFEMSEVCFLRRTAKNESPTPRAIFFITTNLLVTYYKSFSWLNYLKA
jgi:hypothetical protein